MKYTKNQQKVLNHFDANNFREITKENVVQLYSLLNDAPKEVAMKVLDQFDSYKDTVIQSLESFSNAFDHVMNDNTNSINEFYSGLNARRTLAMQIASSPDITNDQKLEILHILEECDNMAFKKDSENKKYHLKALSILSTVIAVTILGTVSVLGVHVNVKQSDNSLDSKDNDTE